MVRGERMNLRERFERHISFCPICDCWLWDGSLNMYGYGKIKVDGKVWGAHRISFILHIGEMPDGMLVCHKCDNPSCVNPKHLFLGSPRDNTIDSVRKNRHANTKTISCPKGHRYTIENTRIDRKGSRTCKICRCLGERLRRESLGATPNFSKRKSL
jgi:HNH endonuclease